MTEQEARERPLNEVWEAFHKMGHLASNKMRLTHYGLVKFSLLRTILLERAQREWGMAIVDGCISLTPVNNMTADECSALVGAMSFMAWELEQRGKEVGNG